MKDSEKVFAIVIVAILILVGLSLLKKKTAVGSSNVRIVGDTGTEIMQECIYADNSVIRQPVRWGPCPPVYQGFPLVTSGGPS